MLFKPASLSDWNLFSSSLPRSLWRVGDTDNDTHYQYPPARPKLNWRSSSKGTYLLSCGSLAEAKLPQLYFTLVRIVPSVATARSYTYTTFYTVLQWTSLCDQQCLIIFGTDIEM